jgi:hypothetical protein
MRIQEMRPGLAHLKKKMERDRLKKIFQPKFEQNNILQIPPLETAAAGTASELDHSRWAVVSFDRVEASGLSYRAAADRLAKLDSEGVAGLCVVTDEAAARLAN